MDTTELGAVIIKKRVWRCFFFAFLQIWFYHSWFGILEARGLLAVGTKDLNEALILGLRCVFLFPFFYSEEVVPLMQKEPHDVGWHDTRRHEKKILSTAYFS